MLDENVDQNIYREKKIDFITVESFFSDMKDTLQFTCVAGSEGKTRKVVEKDMHRPGLALTGFVNLFTHHRIQIIGNTESRYLASLTKKDRQKAYECIFQFEMPCVIITDDNKPSDVLIRLADENQIPLFITPHDTSFIFRSLNSYLETKFAPHVVVHGSLVDVYGFGLLFTGPSGIGKSEIALDLVERGHRLVADDIVKISLMSGDILIGTANDLIQHHMEIRGVGIIDVRRMFGVRGIRLRKRVEVEVQLEVWDNAASYDRTGLETSTREILSTKIPLIRLPIFPGKNITVIAEVIALTHLLKIYGYDPAKEFNRHLIQQMGEKTKEYLERDFE